MHIADLAEVQAIIPRSETRVDGAFLEEISQEIKRITNQVGPEFRKAAEKLQPEVVRNPYVVKELKNLGSLIFSHLLPQAARDKLRSAESCNLYLRLDDQLVHIPWELAFDGQQFLGMKFRLGRQIITHHKIAQTAPARQSSGGLRMLLISDPSETLTNVSRESEQLCEILDRIPGLEVRLLGGRGVKRIPLLAALRESDIVHFAGHSQFDEKSPENSGWLLHDGLLSASEISKLDRAPLLVFSNSCQAGATKNWQSDYLYEGEAFGLGSAFLLAGVSNYIGTFCVVHDEESRFLAVEFYRGVAQGQSIGQALLEARLATAEEMGLDRLTWASYMLYGDPDFSLTGFQPSALVSEPPQTITGAEPPKAKISEANSTTADDGLKRAGSRSYLALAWLFAGLFAAVLAGFLIVMWWSPVKEIEESTNVASVPPTGPEKKPAADQREAKPRPGQAKILPSEIQGPREGSQQGASTASAQIAKAVRDVGNFRFEVESLQASTNTNNVMTVLNITNKSSGDVALALGDNPNQSIFLMDHRGFRYSYRNASGIGAWKGPLFQPTPSDWLTIPAQESRTVSLTFDSGTKNIADPNSSFVLSVEMAAATPDDTRKGIIRPSIMNVSIRDIIPSGGLHSLAKEELAGEKKRLEEARLRVEDNRSGDASRPPPPPGYSDVEVYKIASAAFRNELVNKKVRVVADQLVMANHVSLTPDLASRVVPFIIYHFSKSTAYITALVPKAMVEGLLEQRKGRLVSLYGKLVGDGNGLVLVVQRVE